MAQKPGGSSRKIGRNKDKCKKYKDQNKREENKLRKLMKMAKKAKKLGNLDGFLNGLTQDRVDYIKKRI